MTLVWVDEKSDSIDVDAKKVSGVSHPVIDPGKQPHRLVTQRGRDKSFRDF